MLGIIKLHSVEGYCQQNEMLAKVKDRKTAMHCLIGNLLAYLQLVCSSVIPKLRVKELGLERNTNT